jgi:competence protein ComEA
VREAKNPEEEVRSRLRSVLAPTTDPVRDQGHPAASAPAGGTRARWPTGDEGPLEWADLVPSWPDDLELPEEPGPLALAGPGETRVAVPLTRASSPAAAPLPLPFGASGGDMSGREYAWQFEDGAFDDSEVNDGRQPESGNPPQRLGAGAFDPGRRGVKALAAVAVVVVAIAGFLAWRAQPRVDPVPTPVAAVGAQAVTDPAVAAAKPSAAPEVVIAVAGKVRKPGLVRLPAGSRVADALQAAGGADAGVDVSLLNLARKVVDGELILVGVKPPAGVAVATGPAGGGAPPGPVNLNTATLADLDTLPGVGPVLAQRILDARAAQGGFTAVSDLRKVDGIGDSRYEQLKDLVTV